MVIDPTHISSPIDASVLSAVLPDIPNKLIDDDKIDQLSNDTWISFISWKYSSLTSMRQFTNPQILLLLIVSVHTLL
jgi:hypothetical protein